MKTVNLIVHNLAEGALARAYTIGQALVLLGYKTSVTGPLEKDKNLYAPSPQNIEVRSIPVKSNAFGWNDFPTLYKNLIGDYLYAIKPKPSSYGIAKIKAKISNTPLFLDIDDYELSWENKKTQAFNLKEFYRGFKRRDGYRDPNYPAYTKWLESQIKTEPCVTVTSHFLQKRYGGVYLPNGADTNIFDPALYDAEASKKKYQLEAFQVLMFAGAPRPHKGIEDILIAVEKMGNSNLKVVVLGSNPYDNYHLELQNRWKSRLILLPTVAFDRVGGVLAAADILVIPQRDTLTTQAQFPLKLSAAMAMAKPIITCAVGDIAEIVGDTAYVVKPENPDEIAKAIAKILSDLPAANKIAKQARLRCIDKYSIRQMAVILEPLLKSKAGIK